MFSIFKHEGRLVPSRSDQFDKLYKIHPFLEDLKTNFKLQCNPHHEQAVDEGNGQVKREDVIETTYANETNQKGYQTVVSGRQHQRLLV